jgi:hypothetical protein
MGAGCSVGRAGGSEPKRSACVGTGVWCSARPPAPCLGKTSGRWDHGPANFSATRDAASNDGAGGRAKPNAAKHGGWCYASVAAAGTHAHAACPIYGALICSWGCSSPASCAATIYRCCCCGCGCSAGSHVFSGCRCSGSTTRAVVHQSGSSRAHRVINRSASTFSHNICLHAGARRVIHSSQHCRPTGVVCWARSQREWRCIFECASRGRISPRDAASTAYPACCTA